MPGATSFQGHPHPPQVLFAWGMRQKFPLFRPHGPELSYLLQGLAGLMPGCPVQLYRVYTAQECLTRGLIKLDPVCALVAKLCTGKGCLVLVHIRVLCELAVASSTDTTTFFGNLHQSQTYSFLSTPFLLMVQKTIFQPGQRGCLMISSNFFALSVCSFWSSQA